MEPISWAWGLVALLVAVPVLSWFLPDWLKSKTDANDPE